MCVCTCVCMYVCVYVFLSCEITSKTKMMGITEAYVRCEIIVLIRVRVGLG